ncbi:uncharacterized protein LOC111870787 [Cryptotermes secundus]|uniref:uncharacterized protein LOC111870787 n=1 Tax=Cryptotermes secundus TaxID=105785 RepID=UPI000CD7C471|nr:uncharacterized protein LOC111870787 [Cryptotermes secundus]
MAFSLTGLVSGTLLTIALVLVLYWWCSVLKKRQSQIHDGTILVVASEANPQHVEHQTQPYYIGAPPPYSDHSQYNHHYNSQNAPPPPYSLAVTMQTQTPAYSVHPSTIAR